MKKNVILLFVILAIFSSCSKNQDDTSLTSRNAAQLATQEKSAVVAASTFPGYSFCLNVPWIKQFPPGDMDHTLNCGQTCAVMLSGYFNNTVVNSAAITAENTWLYIATGTSAFNNPNGYVTTDVQIQALLKQKHGLTAVSMKGTSVDDMLIQAYSGKPCMANVMIKGGLLVSAGGKMHWTLVIGYDGCNIITNDPGTQYGFNKIYSRTAFAASWATGNNLYMPVSKDNLKFRGKKFPSFLFCHIRLCYLYY